MNKLDYFLLIIIMVIALFLFAIFQISSNQLSFDFFVKIGIFENSKETVKGIFITFYSLLALFFILLALIFIRILVKLFKK